MSKILLITFAIFFAVALAYFFYVAYVKSVRPKKEQILSVVIEPGSPAIRDGRLIESIGIETLGGVFTPLLQKDAPLPCRASNIFSTARDNQEMISLSIYRGKKERVKENHPLGDFDIVGIPPAPKGLPEIKITIGAMDDDLLLEVAHKFGENALRIERK